MRWTRQLGENVKHTLRSWLNIQPASPYNIQINEVADFELNAIRNRIWYRGDSNELEQMYQELNEYADKYKFWASKCTPGMEMRKIHTGLPSLIVRILSAIVLADMNDFKFQNSAQEVIWKEIEKQNKFRKKMKRVLRETLYIGDGAWKIRLNTEKSEYPFICWYPGDRIELVQDGDELQEVIFKTLYKGHGKQYVLHEHYGYGYIHYELYMDDKIVDLSALDQTKGLKDWQFDKRLMLAVPLQVYESTKWEGRGGSIFDGKLDSFDAFDEAWSQWMDALRAGRSKTYIPECLVPHDPETGEVIRPNPFDNRYFSSENDMSENAENKIDTEQPSIPHDSYLASYTTALDLCLQGIISPSTLGIDVKKLDNAEAQREKEKATLYTRNAIVEALQDTLPELIGVCVNAYQVLHGHAPENIEVDIPFGEYANPSFESQVETVAKGKQGGIMSIEASVEELYGDSKNEAWKAEEVARLKNEQGISVMGDEPGVNQSAGDFQIKIDGGTQNAGQGGKQNIPDEPGRISGASGSSKGAGADGNLRSGKI